MDSTREITNRRHPAFRTICSAALACIFIFMAGCGGSSSTTPTTATPTGLTATALDSGSVSVAWAAVPDATSYTLYYSTDPNATKQTATKITGITGTTYTCTGHDYLYTYYYSITAVGPHGESGPSQIISCVLPPIPPDFVSITAGVTSLAINWTDVPGATSYNIYRGTAPDVTVATGSKTAGVTSPYLDNDVVQGTVYYYIVTAVGPGGESIASEEVGAAPKDPPPGAPLNVTASLTAETTLSVTISWTEPVTGTAPASYNIYRSTTSPVTVEAANLLANAAALPGQLMQYIDTNGLVGQTTYYYVVTSVTDGSESLPSAEVSATPHGSSSGGGGGGGETDTGFGNNLAAPVIFANPYGITGLPITGSWTLDPAAIDFNTGLRPLSTEAALATITSLPYLDPTTTLTLNNVTYYKQATASTWQAQWAVATEPVHVTAKWGDNLISRVPTTNSTARVEMVLTQGSLPAAMTGYTIKSLYGSRTAEVTGTDGTTYQATSAVVFAPNARLKIEKLDGAGGNVVWTYLDKAVYEKFGADGQVTGMAAEIGVGGGLAFGFNWPLNQITMPTGIEKTGWWRLTFSLDPEFTIGTASGLTNNTLIDSAVNGSMVSETEVYIEVNIGSGSGG